MNATDLIFFKREDITSFETVGMVKQLPMTFSVGNFAVTAIAEWYGSKMKLAMMNCYHM